MSSSWAAQPPEGALVLGDRHQGEFKIGAIDPNGPETGRPKSRPGGSIEIEGLGALTPTVLARRGRLG